MEIFYVKAHTIPVRKKEITSTPSFHGGKKKRRKKMKEWCARCCKTLERQAGEAWKREPLEKLRSANFKFELKRKRERERERERSGDSYTARLLASRQVPSYFTRLTKNSRIRVNVALRRQLKYLPRHNRVCGMSWRLVGTVGTRRNPPPPRVPATRFQNKTSRISGRSLFKECSLAEREGREHRKAKKMPRQLSEIEPRGRELF